MDRKKFIEFLGISTLLPIPVILAEPKEKKLVQVKEFNKANITQEIAGKICAVVCMQSAYKNPDRDFVFVIEDELSIYANKPKTPDGVTISITRPSSEHGTQPWKVRIWKNGRAMAHIFRRKGDWKSSYTGWAEKGIPPSVEYHKEDKLNIEDPCDHIELVQLYISLGFYNLQ